jgi:predicted nucleic acid-binding protein
MNLLLDSTFIIDVLNGDAGSARRWRQLFADGDNPVTCEIVVCEVRSGLLEDEVGHLSAFLEPVEFVQPSVSSALLAGGWRMAARSRGRTLSLADALIAAAAEAVGGAVLTRNTRDFALTPVPIASY